MIRIYIPASHESGTWVEYTNTCSTFTDWCVGTPGMCYCIGDVCSADYRSDKNVVSVNGKMGARLCYSFLPFVIRNEFASPHTYMYDVGFSSVILNPSTKNTGLDINNNPASGILSQNFSSNIALDASYQIDNFAPFTEHAFGFRILGCAIGTNNIWNLQNTYFWYDPGFAFDVINNRFTLTPEMLASAVDYCYYNGKSNNAIEISPSLGIYYPCIWSSRDRYNNIWMKRYGSFVYEQPDGGTLILERNAMLWGYFYFTVVDSDKITYEQDIASKRFETNLVTTGNVGDANYLYPAFPNDFSIETHSKWTSINFGAIPSRSRSMWYGVDFGSCRESRSGWFIAGRKID